MEACNILPAKLCMLPKILGVLGAVSIFSHICIPYLALGYVGSSSFELCFRIIAKHWDCFVNHNILQWAKKSYFTGTENILSSSEITTHLILLFHWNREYSQFQWNNNALIFVIFTGTENILGSSEITNLGGLLFHWNRECSEKNTTFPKRGN